MKPDVDLAVASSGEITEHPAAVEREMDERTLEALKGSIEKWKDIEAGTGVDNSSWNCPLCRLFLLHRGSCRGCPVYRQTGERYCVGTPFSRWVSAQIDEQREHPFRVITPEHKELARAEREFLESLLPRTTDRGPG